MTVGHERSSVDDFVAETEALLAKRMPTQTTADELVVRRHAKRLSEAGLERAAFEPVIAELTSDKAARKAELDAIAHAYIGGRESQPSKNAGVDAIERKFLERVRFAKKKDLFDTVTPW
ncbi:MAG: hypothetical protein MI723_06395 [Caulobacterales bacterium]|nr:hypothetical protein [Caulobacterales bacterium]